MPTRPYRLGKRADAMARTRLRILRASARLYVRQGIRATSVQEIARIARLSPATVLNHFPTRDRLDRAVIRQLMEDLRIPDETILRGATDLQERLRRFAVAMAEFYVASEPWYRVYAREREEVAALREGEERFYRGLHRLLRVVLGPLARRGEVRAAVLTFAGPAALGELRSHGLTAREAGALAASVLIPWLERQSRSRPGAGR